jgi:Fe-S-cluster-containing hydrogenase component 2
MINMSNEEKVNKEVYKYPGFAWDPPYAMVTVNHRLCSGCRICEAACSVKNFGEFNPELSKIRIYDFYAGLLQIPSVCWGCQWRGGEAEGGLDAPCVKACPTKALSWHETLWIPVVDEETCNKCGLCYEECPQHAIKENTKTGFPNVCTRCDGDPECVKRCPTGALAAYKAGEGNVGLMRAYGMRSIESVAEDARIHHLSPWKGLEDWKKLRDE